MADYADATSIPIVITWIDPTGWDVTSGDGNMTVKPIASRETIITWKPIPAEAGVSLIYVQKSGIDSSGWKTMAVHRTNDVNSELDERGNNTFYRNGVDWYRLVLPEVQRVIGPMNSFGYLDALGSEISYRHRVKLKEGKCGNPCYLFMRLRDGSRCPICWDDILQKRCRDDCPTCVGTGFINGYYNPVLLYVNFPSEVSAIQHEVDGANSVDGTIQVWTGSVPEIGIGDVIIEDCGNQIWYVDKVHVSTHKRVVIKQTLVITKSTGDDPVWGLVQRMPEGDVLY